MRNGSPNQTTATAATTNIAPTAQGPSGHSRSTFDSFIRSTREAGDLIAVRTRFYTAGVDIGGERLETEDEIFKVDYDRGVG